MGSIEQMGLIVLKLNQQMVTGGQGCREFFLGVHGAEGEQASGQAQSGDHVLGSSAAERRLTTRASGCQAVRAETAVPDPKRAYGGAGVARILMRGLAAIRHPYRGQLARPQQTGQLHRIAPVGLHPVARPARDQRRGNHSTTVPQGDKLAIQPVARRSRFVAQMQLAMPLLQSRHNLAN